MFHENIGGVDLALRKGTPDRHVARSCLESEEFAVCASTIASPRFNFIVDAGGYIGTAAIWFAKTYPDAKIVTVEPSIDNFSILQQNVAPFKNIVALNMAVVARSRKVRLVDRGTGDWGFSIVKYPRDRPDPAPLHEVQGVTLDELIFDNRVRGIDILKLDIEGGEKEVFELPGYWARNTDMLIAELHDRITAGCAKAYLSACAHMQQLSPAGGEKVVSISSHLLP